MLPRLGPEPGGDQGGRGRYLPPGGRGAALAGGRRARLALVRTAGRADVPPRRHRAVRSPHRPVVRGRGRAHLLGPGLHHRVAERDLPVLGALLRGPGRAPLHRGRAPDQGAHRRPRGGLRGALPGLRRRAPPALAAGALLRHARAGGRLPVGRHDRSDQERRPRPAHPLPDGLLPARDPARGADRRVAGPAGAGRRRRDGAGAGRARLPGGDRRVRVLPGVVLAAAALPRLRPRPVPLLDAARRRAPGLGVAGRSAERQPGRRRGPRGSRDLPGEPLSYSAPTVWEKRVWPSSSTMRTVRPAASIAMSPKLALPPRLHSERGVSAASSGRGLPGEAESGPAMNSWKDQSGGGWWRISSAWCTSPASTTRFFTPRPRRARRIASRSIAKPVPCPSGTPRALALLQESRARSPLGT